jgi:hypothetical protein
MCVFAIIVLEEYVSFYLYFFSSSEKMLLFLDKDLGFIF